MENKNKKYPKACHEVCSGIEITDTALMSASQISQNSIMLPLMKSDNFFAFVLQIGALINNHQCERSVNMRKQQH